MPTDSFFHSPNNLHSDNNSLRPTHPIRFTTPSHFCLHVQVEPRIKIITHDDDFLQQADYSINIICKVNCHLGLKPRRLAMQPVLQTATMAKGLSLWRQSLQRGDFICFACRLDVILHSLKSYRESCRCTSCSSKWAKYILIWSFRIRQGAGVEQ